MAKKKKIVKKQVVKAPKDGELTAEPEEIEEEVEVDDEEATELVADDEKKPVEEPVHPKLLNKPVPKAPPREKEKANPVKKVGNCQCKDAGCEHCKGGEHENDANTMLISSPALGQVTFATMCVECVRDKFKRYLGVSPQPIG